MNLCGLWLLTPSTAHALSLLSADFHNKVSRVFLQGASTSLPCCGVSPKKKPCGSFASSLVTDAASTTVDFFFFLTPFSARVAVVPPTLRARRFKGAKLPDSLSDMGLAFRDLPPATAM